jgi:hypothetical protein
MFIQDEKSKLSLDDQIFRIAREYSEGRVRVINYVDSNKKTGYPNFDYLSVNRVFDEKFGENISQYYPSEALVLAKKLSETIAEINKGPNKRPIPVVVGVEIDGITYNFLNDDIFEVLSPVISNRNSPTPGVIYSPENLDFLDLEASIEQDSVKESTLEVKIRNLHKLK